MDKALSKYKIVESGCHEWTGGKNKYGYGKITRKINGKKHYLVAHRFYYECLVEKIPNGMVVMHKCDNPSCVNVEHLMLGTNADNIADCVNKGRNYKGPKPWVKGTCGEKHGASKLKTKDIKTIRHLYFAERQTLSVLADYYSVAFQTISKIVNKKTWKSVVPI